MKYTISIFLLFLVHFTQAVEDYSIKVTMKNRPSDTLYLGYYYADKQYLRDTAISKNGQFHFQKSKAIEPGIYLLVMPPANDFIQLFINKNETVLEIEVDAKEIVNSFKIKGSTDNETFYEYLRLLDQQRPKAMALTEELKSTTDDIKKKGIQSKLDKVNQEVKDKQQQIVNAYPQSLSSILIKSTFEVPMIEFTGTKEEVDLRRYLYYKSHYFDHLNLGDERLLRSPILHERINYYIEKLTPQHPDSISLALDYIFSKLKPAEESFKYYLIHYLNLYANSKIVGYDGIYVHLVDNYYSKGVTPWVDKDQLDKIIKNASDLRPILVGKIAPEIRVTRYPELTPVSLHKIKSPYTILFIWDPECSHCKASLPHIIKFYEKFKTKGVEILAICSQFTDKVPNCWKYLEENKMNPGWINAADPYHESKYKVLYNVKTTPQIFVLNNEKKILSKGIGAEQLDELMEQILQEKM